MDLSDPWAKRLKWGAFIGLSVVWILSLWMAWNGGAAMSIVRGYEERDSLVVERLSREADRIDAAREAYTLCRRVDTQEVCQ